MSVNLFIFLQNWRKVKPVEWQIETINTFTLSRLQNLCNLWCISSKCSFLFVALVGITRLCACFAQVLHEDLALHASYYDAIMLLYDWLWPKLYTTVTCLIRPLQVHEVTLSPFVHSHYPADCVEQQGQIVIPKTKKRSNNNIKISVVV